MKNSEPDGSQASRHLPKKILLGILPYWTPLIPPMGIAYLKGYLEPHGFEVSLMDANMKLEFKDLYNKYFATMKVFIPENKRGNYFNIGHDLLQNHMMAHFRHTNKEEYYDLVRKIIYETYFCSLEDDQISELNKILDTCFQLLEEYVIQKVEAEKPDVFGLSVYVHTLPASLFAFKLVKERYPHIATVMGGPTFIWQFPVDSPEFNFLLEKTAGYLDTFIVGEGQQIFLKYLQGELPASKRYYTREDLGKPMLGINAVPPPDFTGLNVDYYPYLATFGSRSCPNQCSFCTISRFFGEYYERDTQGVIKEISDLREKYGERQVFFFIDSLVNSILPTITPELARQETAIYFDGYLRVDDACCDIENTLAWRRGGFYRARIGVESGSQKILDLIDKKITLDQIRASLVNLATAGIKTTTFWIIGHPGETEADFQETLDFVEELKDYIYEAEFNPFFYFYAGQSHGDEWVKQSRLLYPEKARDMLISQTYVLEVEPSRRETYSRLNRFIDHCRKLGIPNPYSMNEIMQADERWKKLHKNAAPALIHLEDPNVYVDDRGDVHKLVSVKNSQAQDATFGF